MAVQPFVFDVKNLFSKSTTFTPVFRLLLVMTAVDIFDAIALGFIDVQYREL